MEKAPKTDGGTTKSLPTFFKLPPKQQTPTPQEARNPTPPVGSAESSNERGPRFTQRDSDSQTINQRRPSKRRRRRHLEGCPRTASQPATRETSSAIAFVVSSSPSHSAVDLLRPHRSGVDPRRGGHRPRHRPLHRLRRRLVSSLPVKLLFSLFHINASFVWSFVAATRQAL